MAIDKQVYFPERYLQSRQHAADLVNAISNLRSIFGYSVGSLIDPNMTVINMLLQNYPQFREDVNILGEYLLATAHEYYLRQGRNIFHLVPNLLSEFRETDVGDIPLSSVQYPYNSFYIHFGAQHDLMIGEELTASGVYVMKSDVELVLLVTGVSLPGTLQTTAIPSDFMNPIGIRFGDHSGTIAEAFDNSIKSEIARQQESIKSVNRKLGAPPAETDMIKKLSMATSPVYVNSLRKVLDIAINAICYMTSYQDELQVVEDEESVQLNEQLAAATSKKAQRRLRNRLGAAGGYTTIRFCGLSLGSGQEKGLYSRGAGNEKRPHWRRGHWRHQRSGVGLTVISLKWIRPVLIHADQGGAPLAGHIYIEDRETSTDFTVSGDDETTPQP